MLKKKERRVDKGISLLELLMVVSIISILSAVAIPSISKVKPRYELRAEARELVINLKKAKLEAVKHKRNVLVFFTPGVGNAGGYQVFVDMNANFLYDAGIDTEIIEFWPLRRNVRLTTDPGFNSTGFNSRAMLVGGNGSVVLSATETDPYTISVFQSGSVRMQR
jgi:prepilin-type N-terminal cleavage/methylation domain-containing protein